MATNPTIVLDVDDRPTAGMWVVLSLQHLFAMFGSTILVPFLTGLSPAVALISSGLGTLTYLLITRGQIPAYIGSSFAFIAPIISAKTVGGVEGAMIGCMTAGLIYGVVALAIRYFGVRWLLRLLPAVVVGPVIIVIGLSLASIAVDMAMNDPVTKLYSTPHFLIALGTLAAALVAGMYFRGVLALIPILVGIIFGYCLAFGWDLLNERLWQTEDYQAIIDWSKVMTASWISIPDFNVIFVSYSFFDKFNLAIIALIAPVAFVTIAEHIGDQMVLSRVAGRNFLEKPGLHRSLFGDGVATLLAAFIGGPPNTTYGENIGVVALTRVLSVFVIGLAAVFAIMFGFIGKISALIQTIPVAVMGGVSILLFGVIAASGLRMLVDKQVDFGNKRNLMITSVILVIGIGGAFIQVNDDFKIAGMALSAFIGIFLNIIFPDPED